MSRIKEFVEELKERISMEEMEVTKKTAVTMLLLEDDIWRLDYLAQRFSTRRTPMAAELISQAAFEAMEALGFDLNEQKCMFLSHKSGRPIEDIRADMAKTGIFPIEEGK